MRIGIPLFAALALADATASACGCFTPPDPTVPVVQAGERILFSIENGQVTAHIQIQYAGAAGDFGWLLPLPSVPTLELGVDELFSQLIATTQPKYRLQRVYNGACRFGGGRGFGYQTPNASVDGAQDPAGKMMDVVVVQGSVGPYDYAVLHGDDKQEMLDWMAKNHYFVPAGTDDVVQNYIHPGAYFLALKLRPGNGAGDLQPVVVRYASDLPMIPIVLSSVAAQPNMGIQVWMLGPGRAIPRNYYHTVLDDAAIDWLNAGANYNDVIIRATQEAPQHHTFVTEYAGSSSVMQKKLDYPGRFADPDALRAIADPAQYLQQLFGRGFPTTSEVTNLIGKQLPEPPGIAALGVSAAQYYANFGYWHGWYKQHHPQLWSRVRERFDPVALTDELWQRVVVPTQAASALFDRAPTLTRLYTTLSPEDMNRDPVFSYNPSLPDVSNVHTATLTYECGLFGSDDQSKTYAWLRTEQGYTWAYPDGVGSATVPSVPASQQIQVLRETGGAEVVTDNSDAITRDLGQSGCAVGGRGSPLALGLIAVALAALALRRRARA